VYDDEQVRMPDGSELQNEGAVTLKLQEAKVVQTLYFGMWHVG